MFTNDHLGVYIHIPFCKQSCYYCNFFHSTNLKWRELLIEAILGEIILRKEEFKNKKIFSIYFGGGTPSVISFLYIANIISCIEKICNFLEDIEITIEVNPDDIDEFILENYKKAGINRLSIGVQSFNDSVLVWLNRSHSSQRVINSLELIKSAKFENFNIDLIYAIPISNFDILYSDLQKAVSFSPSHISAYNLTIEKKTVLGYRYKKKIIDRLCDDEEILQYRTVVNFLKNSGYNHYEISNFCIANRESKHNTGYWNGDFCYLGLGPSAHSYNGLCRKINVNNNYTYINKISNSLLPYTVEILSYEDKINEYIMTSLRTCNGCSLIELKSKYNIDLMDLKQREITDYKKRKFCFFHEDKLILSEKGFLLADFIASNLFV